MSRYLLALDVGFASMGWAVGTSDRIVQAGTLVTKPSAKKKGIRAADDRVRRASEMFRQLTALADQFQPVGVVAELPHGGAKSAAAMAAMAGGSALAAAFVEAHAYPVEWYTPGDCKEALLGKRSGSKGETEARIRMLYPDVVWPGTKALREHAIDAAAVLVAARTGNLMRGLRVDVPSA